MSTGLPSYVRGNAILIEIEVEKHLPFEEASFNNPENGVTISITDPNGDLVVTEQSMLYHALGQYYYIYQSAVDGKLGKYSANVIVDGLVYDGKYIKNSEFRLIRTK